eukprot:CAMPEP_0202726632 /NCGR_PEP_ID=MMETSP1385-20130828/184711_1 /ASSEMBLY_ACC=CAM_ASM_000861 /TAXON_ID=933848 /ORGANISM="Elphidium margaritaceum" /LENGTH=256 /DNA_ID=CAMNT_0049392855 /DNA_START=163 /DNA_END=934 /DNA_ORIENTATION=-
MQVPSVPLDKEEARAYISQYAAVMAAYYRNEVDFADIFEGIWDERVFTVNADGKSMNFQQRNEADFADIFEGIWDKSVFTVNADGKSMNFHAAKAQSEQVRRKISSVSSQECALTDENSFPSFNIYSLCTTLPTFSVPIAGDRQVSMSYKRVFHFGEDGLLVAMDLEDQQNGVIGKIISTVSSLVQSSMDEADGQPFLLEIGGHSIDKFDAAVIITLAGFSLIIATVLCTLCCLVRRGNGLYKRTKHAYAFVNQDA